LLSNDSNIGWLCAFTWQTGLGGCAYFVGTLIQALLVLRYPDYHYHTWHGSLLALAYLIIVVIFNTFLARKLPMLECIFVFIHIVGILIFIPLLILSPRREGGSPLVDFYNPGGWISNGVATMIGGASPITALIGFDCSVHMCMVIYPFGLLFLTYLPI
jgi:amino acid transporter